MKQNPLISVIIPVWNGEHYLDECLSSVLAQTMTDFEVIVVDDGSRDRTWDKLTAWQKRDDRIHIYHQPNGGVSNARNAAMTYATGKFYRFVDVDDHLPEDSLAHLVSQMEENSSDMVIAAYTEVLGNIRNVRDLGKCCETVDNAEYLKRLERLSNSFYYGVLWNKIFRSDIIREHALTFTAGLDWGEDFVFVMHYLQFAERITYTTKPVYDYIRNIKGAVMRQTLNCIIHPIASIGARLTVYRSYVALYQARGLYGQYRHVLWQYLFRFTLRN